nr:penicillin-binding protein 2 [Alphaproteobacteria bacterium]
LIALGLPVDANQPRLARSGPPPVMDPGRAEIVDRNGVLLATSLKTASLYANPNKLMDRRDTAVRLARVFPELDADSLLGKLRSGKSFVWVKRNLTPREKAAVNALGIPGLDFLTAAKRSYPYGALTAHVLGYTDVDGRGLAGIEQSFDEALETGREPLRLSIDVRVQHILREELSGAIETFQAIGGGAVAMDVQTGEVLGMVSLPDFDPNEPAKATDESRFNRISLGVYEMGSTFKLFTAAMALDAGVTSLQGGYDASRPLRVSRFTITDYHAQNRWLSVPEIILHSSNIGAALMAKDVGPQAHRAFMDKFGMLKRTGLELPELGDPLEPRPWREINTLTIAYGHGLAVTPLHLVSGISALVNGGLLHAPTLIARASDRTYSADHEIETDEQPNDDQVTVATRVIGERTSDALRHLMRIVVEKGTGKNAQAEGYVVGGKTGTAEKNLAGRYQRKALISSFVAAFPMDAPRYVVLAMLDEPKGTKETFGYATGGWVAAPVVGRAIARIGPLLGIAPRGSEVTVPTPARLQRAALGALLRSQTRATF